MSIRDSIIARAKEPLRLEAVKQSGWDDCFIKEMNGGELQDYNAMCSQPSILKKMLVIPIIISTVVDKDRNPLFTIEDVDTLNALSSHEILAVGRQSMKLNRLHRNEETDTEKNSSSGQK